jgi:hypothetical protein
MTDTPNFDEIPVLTEVVAEQEPETDPAAEALPASAAPDLEEGSVPDAPAQSTGPDDDAWRTLEERLVTRVLDRLQPRIDLVLEDQVRDQMAIVLEHVAERVVAELRAELRAALQQSIEHVVARAVQQELDHLNARQA